MEQRFNWKKELVKRLLTGFPAGIAIGYVMTIFVSLCIGEGRYSPCVPAFAEMMGNELAAVILQTVLTGVMGAGYSASSVIWQMDWSLFKQTAVYFGVVAVLLLPVAYITHWMQHSFIGVLLYVATFIVIFAVIWGIVYAANKRKVKAMNASLQQTKQEGNR